MAFAFEITIADLMAFEVTDLNPDPWPPDLKLKETSDPCTDAANAQRFAEQFGCDVLYIDGLRWHRFIHPERRQQAPGREKVALSERLP